MNEFGSDPERRHMLANHPSIGFGLAVAAMMGCFYVLFGAIAADRPDNGKWTLVLFRLGIEAGIAWSVLTWSCRLAYRRNRPQTAVFLAWSPVVVGSLWPVVPMLVTSLRNALGS